MRALHRSSDAARRQTAGRERSAEQRKNQMSRESLEGGRGEGRGEDTASSREGTWRAGRVSGDARMREKRKEGESKWILKGIDGDGQLERGVGQLVASKTAAAAFWPRHFLPARGALQSESRGRGGWVSRLFGMGGTAGQHSAAREPTWRGRAGGRPAAAAAAAARAGRTARLLSSWSRCCCQSWPRRAWSEASGGRSCRRRCRCTRGRTGWGGGPSRRATTAWCRRHRAAAPMWRACSHGQRGRGLRRRARCARSRRAGCAWGRARCAC